LNLSTLSINVQQYVVSLPCKAVRGLLELDSSGSAIEVSAVLVILTFKQYCNANSRKIIKCIVCYFTYFTVLFALILDEHKKWYLCLINLDVGVECFWGCKILILPKINKIFPNPNHFCPNFAQIFPNLPNIAQTCPIFSQTNQICLNLINFALKIFAR